MQNHCLHLPCGAFVTHFDTVQDSISVSKHIMVLAHGLGSEVPSSPSYSTYKACGLGHKNDKIALSIRTESKFLSGMITAYIRERNLHPIMIFSDK